MDRREMGETSAEIHAAIKERQKLIAKVERMDRERTKELRFLASVLTDLDSIDSMGYTELARLHSKLLKLKPIMEADEMADVMHAHEEVDQILEHIESLINFRIEAEKLMRTIERNNKIAERRAKEQPAQKVDESTLCVVCHKRLKHFDDWCKRCVPPDKRPTGKVV